MIYSANITSAANNVYTKSSPKRTVLSVTKGLVYKVELDFPSGSAGLMGVAIADGGFQVWPSNIGNWFTGDNISIDFEDTYLKESAPYQFNIYTYNEDTVYPHLVNVRIGLVSKDIFMARFLPHLSYKYYADMLRQLESEQKQAAEVQKQEITETPFPWLKTE